jgi:acyl CoA:acetate/3-ketoacid CoA transferase alpha subunit
MILSYVGTNKNLQDAYLGGEISLELNPQGTIAERLRAGGAGMPAVFTRTGAGESVSFRRRGKNVAQTLSQQAHSSRPEVFHNCFPKRALMVENKRCWYLE